MPPSPAIGAKNGQARIAQPKKSAVSVNKPKMKLGQVIVAPTATQRLQSTSVISGNLPSNSNHKLGAPKTHTQLSPIETVTPSSGMATQSASTHYLQQRQYYQPNPSPSPVSVGTMSPLPLYTNAYENTGQQLKNESAENKSNTMLYKIPSAVASTSVPEYIPQYTQQRSYQSYNSRKRSADSMGSSSALSASSSSSTTVPVYPGFPTTQRQGGPAAKRVIATLATDLGPIGNTSNQAVLGFFDNGSNDSGSMRHKLRAQKLVFGKYLINTWYPSPYPQEIRNSLVLYLCEFTLQYHLDQKSLSQYQRIVKLRHPPGKEIYRKNNLSFFEVDGQQHTVYSQNLCLLSQLFLKHKTLHYEVDDFMFYVLVEWDHVGAHFIGYFSKEKHSSLDYNLSCIMTMPQFQRKGYGRLLIDFSYLLTRKERKTGSPEKPLSDLGLLSYRSYWKEVLFTKLAACQGNISIKQLSMDTGIDQYDIVTTLQSLGLIKYWRGMHFVVKPTDLDDWVNAQALKAAANPLFPRLDYEALRWDGLVEC